MSMCLSDRRLRRRGGKAKGDGDMGRNPGRGWGQVRGLKEESEFIRRKARSVTLLSTGQYM